MNWYTKTLDRIESAKSSDRNVARSTRQTVAEFDADTTANDPLDGPQVTLTDETGKKAYVLKSDLRAILDAAHVRLERRSVHVDAVRHELLRDRIITTEGLQRFAGSR